MLKRIISRLTMKRISCQFIDKNGKEVFLYVDIYGQNWLSEFNFLTSIRMLQTSKGDK